VDGSEVGGQGGDEVEVLGVGVPAAVLPDHVVGLAEGGGALENVAQGARAVLEVGDLLAEDGGLLQLEGLPWARQVGLDRGEIGGGRGVGGHGGGGSASREGVE
jgi:hypothetical protein